MSRGPGRIERVIEVAFTAEPSRAFTVEALAVVAYPGINRVEKKHRVSVLRAAHRVAERLGWRSMRGGEGGDGVHFYNPVDVRSYAEARIRGDDITRMDLRRGCDWGRLEANLASLDDPESKFGRLMAPGGDWWEVVEKERCRRSGDHARANELEAKHEAEFQAMLAGFKAMFGGRKRLRGKARRHLVCGHTRFVRGKVIRVRSFERDPRRDKHEGR